jgi:hypothetical protein
MFVSVGLIRFAKTCISPRYFLLALRSPVLARQYQELKVGGSHTNKLNLGDIPKLVVPVPPLAEQKRIVARVDELMALCDQLDASHRAKRTARQRGEKAALDALSSAETPDDFASAWERVAQNFAALVDEPDDVRALRQAVLVAAFQGRLTGRRRRLVPASVSVEGSAAIAAATGRAATTDVRARTCALSVGPASMLIPEDWSWIPLLSVASLGRGTRRAGITPNTGTAGSRGSVSRTRERHTRRRFARQSRRFLSLGDLLSRSEGFPIARFRPCRSRTPSWKWWRASWSAVTNLRQDSVRAKQRQRCSQRR